MAAGKRNKARETARNILLVLLALGMVLIFFNLDFIKEGDSVFSHEGRTKLYFRGDLARTAFEEKEIDQLLDSILKRSKILESATVETRLQDSYKRVTASSPVIFEIHLVMKSGARISTTARRSSRGSLVPAILAKMSKDIRVYKDLKRQGKDVKSLINAN